MMVGVASKAMNSIAVAAFALLAQAVPGHAEDLRSAPPEVHGFASGKLAQVLDAVVAAQAPIHSLMLVRGGDVLLDATFYPYDGGSHDLASVTKSVTTSLVAIAAGEGALDLDAPMLTFFPGRAIANIDARKQKVTVRQLTQNLSGLACVGYPEEVTLARMQASPDFLQFALDLPMAHEPGTHFDYCSPGMHILSAILQQATGMSEAAFAEEKLFAPLGITGATWSTDPQGITHGWGDLDLAPGDMQKLGTLWLHGGSWNGLQVIPADWLATATTRARRSDRYEDYGDGFWVGPSNEPIPYFSASGRGGQRILVAPALDLVIVTTGGGIDPGDIIDPMMTALVDPQQPLPADPAGEAALAKAIGRAAAAPAAKSPADLPPLAAQVSGKTYRFAANAYGIESIMLDFPGGAEATMTLSLSGVAVPRPVGLDDVYRFSPGEYDIALGVRGAWRDDRTFVLDYNTIGKIRAYGITCHFTGKDMELTIDQKDEPMTVKLTGTSD